ncbi:hypothetical protein ACUNFO_19565, partial [Serratia sp. IR-2025]
LLDSYHFKKIITAFFKFQAPSPFNSYLKSPNQVEFFLLQILSSCFLPTIATHSAIRDIL